MDAFWYKHKSDSEKSSLFKTLFMKEEKLITLRNSGEDMMLSLAEALMKLIVCTIITMLITTTQISESMNTYFRTQEIIKREALEI